MRKLFVSALVLLSMQYTFASETKTENPKQGKEEALTETVAESIPTEKKEEPKVAEIATLHPQEKQTTETKKAEQVAEPLKNDKNPYFNELNMNDFLLSPNAACYTFSDRGVWKDSPKLLENGKGWYASIKLTKDILPLIEKKDGTSLSKLLLNEESKDDVVIESMTQLLKKAVSEIDDKHAANFKYLKSIVLETKADFLNQYGLYPKFAFKVGAYKEDPKGDVSLPVSYSEGRLTIGINDMMLAMNPKINIAKQIEKQGKQIKRSLDSLKSNMDEAVYQVVNDIYSIENENTLLNDWSTMQKSLTTKNGQLTKLKSNNNAELNKLKKETGDNSLTFSEAVALVQADVNDLQTGIASLQAYISQEKLIDKALQRGNVKITDKNTTITSANISSAITKNKSKITSLTPKSDKVTPTKTAVNNGKVLFDATYTNIGKTVTEVGTLFDKLSKENSEIQKDQESTEKGAK